METITIILVAASLYMAMGFVFAIPFIIKGVIKIDEGAHESGWGFRLIIIPGVIVFWPLLLKKWIAVSKNSTHDKGAA